MQLLCFIKKLFTDILLLNIFALFGLIDNKISFFKQVESGEGKNNVKRKKEEG